MKVVLLTLQWKKKEKKAEILHKSKLSENNLRNTVKHWTITQ